MKRIAIILSGSGVYDGSEIHEATLTMLAIEKQGATYEIFAPSVDQHHVINHITGEEMSEKRNVLVESARIARGAIKDINKLQVDDFDTIILPGGFGAAKNLSSFAFKGADLAIENGVSATLKKFYDAKKPIGALCIAPVILAKLFKGAKLTIGQDESTATAIETLGGNHQKTTHGEIVVDEKYRLVTSPCYMLDASISQIEKGVSNTVKALLEIA